MKLICSLIASAIIFPSLLLAQEREQPDWCPRQIYPTQSSGNRCFTIDRPSYSRMEAAPAWSDPRLGVKNPDLWDHPAIVREAAESVQSRLARCRDTAGRPSLNFLNHFSLSDGRTVEEKLMDTLETVEISPEPGFIKQTILRGSRAPEMFEGITFVDEKTSPTYWFDGSYRRGVFLAYMRAVYSPSGAGVDFAACHAYERFCLNFPDNVSIGQQREAAPLMQGYSSEILIYPSVLNRGKFLIKQEQRWARSAVEAMKYLIAHEIAHLELRFTRDYLSSNADPRLRYYRIIEECGGLKEECPAEERFADVLAGEILRCR